MPSLTCLTDMRITERSEQTDELGNKTVVEIVKDSDREKDNSGVLSFFAMLLVAVVFLQFSIYVRQNRLDSEMMKLRQENAALLRDLNNVRVVVDEHIRNYHE